MLAMLVLNDGEVLRFNEIHRYIGGISQKMLSSTLKVLEADGLVQRKVYTEVPVRVEYQLTEQGKGLVPLLQELVDWADQNFTTIQASRKRFKR
jgi:DNA-binding HxlR family transcriptional regulator